MRARCRLLLVAAMALMALACASVVHHSVTNDEKDEGARYLGTSPYLIAYSDGKGGMVMQVQPLPDPNKKMSATPHAKGADIDLTMSFDRGVLNETTESGDTSAIPTSIAKAVEAFAPALLALLNEAQTTQEYSVPAPYVYKIVVKGSEVHFIGGKGDEDFKITLLPQTPKEK